MTFYLKLCVSNRSYEIWLVDKDFLVQMCIHDLNFFKIFHEQLKMAKIGLHYKLPVFLLRWFSFRSKEHKVSKT